MRSPGGWVDMTVLRNIVVVVVACFCNANHSQEPLEDSWKGIQAPQGEGCVLAAIPCASMMQHMAVRGGRKRRYDVILISSVATDEGVLPNLASVPERLHNAERHAPWERHSMVLDTVERGRMCRLSVVNMLGMVLDSVMLLLVNGLHISTVISQVCVCRYRSC